MLSRINWSTVIKLAVASLIVGTVLAVVGADPIDFWRGLYETLRETLGAIFGFGINGVRNAVAYTALGAAVVLPIWIVVVLLKNRKKSSPGE